MTKNKIHKLNYFRLSGELTTYEDGRKDFLIGDEKSYIKFSQEFIEEWGLDYDLFQTDPAYLPSVFQALALIIAKDDKRTEYIRNKVGEILSEKNKQNKEN